MLFTEDNPNASSCQIVIFHSGTGCKYDAIIIQNKQVIFEYY